MENLEGHLQKQQPKWLLVKPQKWHTWMYLGLGLLLTGLAVEEFSIGVTRAEKYLAGSLFAGLATLQYFRFAQFVNYFHRDTK